MVVALALILGAIIVSVFVLGVFWALICLVPFYAYVALAVFLVWRARRKHAELEGAAMREVERQRRFNRQEMRAWNMTLDQDQRNNTERNEAVRDFDSARERPEK